MQFWNFLKNLFKKPANQKVKIMTCRHCENHIRPGRQHLCLSGVRGSSFQAPVNPTQSNSDFLLSYVVANATDSTMMGYAVGGSLPGAMLGTSAHNHHVTHSEPDRFNDQWSSSGSGGNGQNFVSSSRDEEPTRRYEAPEVAQVCSRSDYTTPDTSSYGSSGSSDSSPSSSFSTD
jgi:hypothetical protein